MAFKILKRLEPFDCAQDTLRAAIEREIPLMVS